MTLVLSLGRSSVVFCTGNVAEDENGAEGEKEFKKDATFHSWSEFEVSLQRWSHQTNSVFVRTSSKSVANANNHLKKGERPYNEALKFKYATLSCVQGKQR